MNEKKQGKFFPTLWAIVLIVAVPLFILSFAILLPIAFRPFYYWQIDPLGIPQSSGFTKAEIITAFDDVLDFIWFHAPFKMGNLSYTAEGKAHFEDCVFLFHFDLWVCVISGAIILLLFILAKTKKLRIRHFFYFPAAFFGAIVLLLFIGVLAVYAIIDFDGLFTLFHKICFPGKDNWIFDPNKDQFVLLLPTSFMMNAGLYIGGCVGTLTLVCIIHGIVRKVLDKKQQKRGKLCRHVYYY